jgi:uncharacterized protein YndB with AHSA1/START domain
MSFYRPEASSQNRVPNGGTILKLNLKRVERRFNIMADNEITTTVNSPAEEVFNLISDIANYSKWVSSNSDFFIESKVTPEGTVGLGSTFEDKLRFGKNIGEVVEFQPSKKFVIEQKWYPETYLWKMRVEYHFEPINGSTRITNKFVMTPIEGFEPMKTPIMELARGERIRTLEAVKKLLEK